MRLTGKLLTKLEHSLEISLTPEQRVIMLYRYGHEPRYGFDEEDFVYGMYEVMGQYPDHRTECKRVYEFTEKRDILRRELIEYKRTIGVMTVDESRDLHEWVADGNSVYSNPWCAAFENGHEMDYINGVRFMEDVRKEMTSSNSMQDFTFKSDMSDDEPF